MKQKIMKGFFWNSLSTYWIMGLEFVGAVILARLLLPEDFGVISYITSIYILGFMFINWGAQPYIVKAQDKATKILNSILSLRYVGVAIITIVLLLIYPLIFSNATSEHFLIFLFVGLGRIIVVLSIPIKSLFIKDMDFRRLALVNIITYSVSLALAIYMATNGGGVWAIAVFMTLPELAKGLYFLFKSPVPIFKFSMDKKEIGRFFSFGQYFVYSNIFNRTFERADKVAIQNFAGSASLGYYSQAYQIAGLFGKITLGAIGNVTSSIFGKFQKNKEVLSRNYFLINSVIVRAILFFYIPFFLLTQEAVLFIYGAKWLPITGIAQVMVIYALLKPYQGINAKLHYLVGKPKNAFISYAFEVGFFLVALIPGVIYFGVIGAAWAVNIGIVASVVVLLIKTKDIVPIQLKKIFLTPIIATIITVVIFYFIKNYTVVNNAFLHLAVNSIIISGVYVIALFIMEKNKLMWIISQLKFFKKKQVKT